MTALSDLAAIPAPPQRDTSRPSHPKGWEPGISWDGTAGSITTDERECPPDEAIWRELIADWGLDPNVLEIVDGSIELIGWDSPVKGTKTGEKIRLKRYKARIQRRTGTAADSVDIDALCKLVERRKPARKNVITADRALVVALSDWQLGKGEGDGTAGTVDRILTAIDKLTATVRIRKPSTVYLVGMGDIVEQCAGHYCVSAETPILTAGLRWRRADSLSAGEELIGVEEHPAGTKRHRRYERTFVTANHVENMESVRLRFDDGSELVCTPEHPLLATRVYDTGQTKSAWTPAGECLGLTVQRPFPDVWDRGDDYGAGWLGGMLDGEGSYTRELTVSQLPGPVLRRLEDELERIGAATSTKINGRSGVASLHVRGGIADKWRVLGITNPIRLVDKVARGLEALVHHHRTKVVSVTPIGLHPIARLATSGHTYIANGFVSHNSSQQFTTDLNRREQMRVARRLILAAVDAVIGVERIVLAAVPGNHGENRNGDGKAFTTIDDNDDLAVFENVAEILDSNPDRYGHVSCVLADDATLTLDISGVIVGFRHGHIGGRGAHGAHKIEDWWKGQALGRQDVADAQILVTAHYHHFLCSEATGRTVLQCPAMDPGSSWWRRITGAESPAGMLTFGVGTDYGPRGWGDLALL